jgi:shikimate kinase
MGKGDRIFLTGFMGSGKSTIGPILANTIGYEFADLDKHIESTTGKSVVEIFKEYGESYFRNLERAGVERLASGRRIVISLGGGTLGEAATRSFIHTTGLLVYLRSDPEKLIQRLHLKTDRPMLTDEHGNRLEKEAMRERILEMYHQREGYYNAADVVIDTDEHRVGITVDRLVRQLTIYLE